MKVTIPSSQGGGKGDIDRMVLSLSLPTSCTGVLMGGGGDMEALFQKAWSAANALEGSDHAISAVAASCSSAASITGSESSSSRSN